MASSTVEFNPVAELRHLLSQGLVGTVLESKDAIVIGGRSWKKDTRIDLQSEQEVLTNREGASICLMNRSDIESCCSLKQLFDVTKAMSEFPSSDHLNVMRCLGLGDSDKICKPPAAKRARKQKKNQEEEEKTRKLPPLVSTTKIKNILELPSEVILKILSYLNQKELLIEASLICKRFRDLAMDKMLWTRLTIPKVPSNQKIKIVSENVFQRFTLLKHLNLCERRDTIVLATNALRQCSRLETLMIDIAWREHDKLCNLLDVINDSKSLNSLTLSGEVNTSQLAVKAMCLKNLTTIVIIVSSRYDSNGKLLRALVSNCKKVKNFDLCVDSDAQSLDFFLDNLNVKIEYFSIKSADFARGSICKFSKFKDLQTLKLSDPEHLDGNGLGSITKMTSLKTLALSFCSILTDQHVVESFHRMENLRSLYFGCDALGDPGLMAIANNCPGLTTLGLQECNNVTKAGVQWVLRHCSMLENLDVSRLKLLVKPVLFEGSIAPLKSLVVRYKKTDVRTIKHLIPTLKMFNEQSC